MSEIHKEKGKFQSYDEKVISPTFTVREATFAIDNTYADGKKGRIEDVKFGVYGDSLATVDQLKFDQECVIEFRIGANKGFTKLTAVKIVPGMESADAPF